MDWPDELDVVIDVPRMGIIKRRDDGSVDFVSPLPCPFNYGSVPGTISGDGDRADAIVLGSRLSRGTAVRARVIACVDFVDAGQLDPKWICVTDARAERGVGQVVAFFRLYAALKTLLNTLRGKQGVTAFRGVTRR